MREEVKKKRIAEEKKKKKTLEYFQQLQNEVLVEDTAILEDAEGFQIIGYEYKEILLEDNRDY